MKVENARRLDEQDHRFLALWAADCAEHVLSYFEEHSPKDDRPREALDAARACARGELAMTRAREAAFAAHAAAYAIKTVRAGAVPADAAVAEREWQVRRLPEHLHWVAFSPSVH